MMSVAMVVVMGVVMLWGGGMMMHGQKHEGSQPHLESAADTNVTSSAHADMVKNPWNICAG